MSLTFPTSPRGRTPPGQPKRASHCRCQGGPLLDLVTGACARCGRETKDTIADTFERRARQIAQSRAKQARRAA